MAKGNPLVQFRLEKEAHQCLTDQAKRNGRSPGSEAKERVLVSLVMSGPDPGPKAEQGEGTGNRPAPTKPPPAEPAPAENALQRAVRLREEWEEMQREHPTLAREIGTYEEFERRRP